MRRITWITGVAVLAVCVGAAGKARPLVQDQIKPSVLDDPPIKVRNGSMEIYSPKSQWVPSFPVFAKHWKQRADTLHDEDGLLHGLVVKTNGQDVTTCAVKGKEIYIYLLPSSSPDHFMATISRDGKKVRVRPKGDFQVDSTGYVASHKTTSTEDYITLVRGAEGDSCALSSKAELKVICVDSKTRTAEECLRSEPKAP